MSSNGNWIEDMHCCDGGEVRSVQVKAQVQTAPVSFFQVILSPLLGLYDIKVEVQKHPSVVKTVCSLGWPIRRWVRSQ